MSKTKSEEKRSKEKVKTIFFRYVAERFSFQKRTVYAVRRVMRKERWCRRGSVENGKCINDFVDLRGRICEQKVRSHVINEDK